MAYHVECLKKNGQTVPKKLVLSGAWYDGRKAEARQSSETRAGEGGSDIFNRRTTVRLSAMVELLPGVFVNRALDGQVWLGKPMGTEQFVRQELERQLEQHMERLRGIVAHAQCNGKAVRHNAVSLSKQLALAALKFSANSRSVHFLRSLGGRVVGELAARHDNAINQALAAVLGQVVCEAGEEVPLWGRTEQHVSQSFWKAKDWMRLQGELSIRPWRRYGDAAHVGMLAQAYNSAQLQVGAVRVCAFPAIERVIREADNMMDAVPTREPGTPAAASAWDLLQAWRRVVRETERAFPEPQQRRERDSPAFWLTLTDRRVGNVGMLPERAQKVLSAGPRRTEREDVRTRTQGDTGVGSAERLQLYKASRGTCAGAYWRAQPWMDDGDLH
eukprot:SAG11_NODE_1340_length_5165_cov_3.807146_2_plen_388_part_00